MLINKKITVPFIIFLAVIFLLPEVVLAQAADILGVNDLAEAGVNLGTRDLKEIIGGIVNIFLGFLGILTTLIILYGGFVWMTSKGSAEKVDKAKRLLINGVIGLVIVLASYSIARFILRAGYDGVFGTGGGGPGGGYTTGVGLGAGALDSHYPIRYAKDVSRNTNIYLTFKEPMDVDMLVTNAAICGGVDCTARTGFVDLWKQGEANPITGDQLLVSYSIDPITGFRTFQLNPYGDTNDHLGSNTADVQYRMELGDLVTQNGSVAFPYSNSYNWIFTTGTEFDFTPPTVISVRPVNGSADNPRNSVVQINFSEAINPMLATGDTLDGFLNISVTNNDFDPDNDGVPDPIIVQGEYKISNQYRTVELITTDFCGVNSCGGDVFCLPASNDISPDDLDGLVSDIIADMSGNELDEAYTWGFATNDEIDLIPPTISSMQDPDNIKLIDPIELTFDKELMGSSVNSNNIDLTGGVVPVNYWMRLLSGNIISINHDKFDPSSRYIPSVSSGIKDLRQNCWFPARCNDAGGSCVCNQGNTQGDEFICTGDQL